MNREEIKNTFKSLAQSQGFYGRLLRQLGNSSKEEVDEFYAILEAENFKDWLELILYIES